MKWIRGLFIGCFTGLLVACSNSQASLTYAPSGALTPLVMETATITPPSIATKVPPTNYPSPTQTLTPSPTNTPSPSPTPFPMVAFSGSPSVEKALQALYPQAGGIINGNEALGVPVEGTYVEVPGDVPSPGIFKIILASSFTENHSQKYAVFTGDMINFSVCHGCFAPISGAIFIKKGNTWNIETRNDFLGELGEWGRPPQGKLVKIGSDKYGFQFLDTFQQQGNSITSLTLFSNIDGQLKWILGVPEIAWENIDILTDTGKKLWGYSSSFKFVPGDNPEYYDLILTTTGTKLGQDNSLVETVNEKKTYTFNGTEYILP